MSRYAAVFIGGLLCGLLIVAVLLSVHGSAGPARAADDWRSKVFESEGPGSGEEGEAYVQLTDFVESLSVDCVINVTPMFDGARFILLYACP